jgi:hypothetical protein
MTVAAAFPFIQIRIDTSALTPVQQRAPGVIAVVGTTPAGANGGTAPVNTPLVVDTLDQAAELFAKMNPDGTVAETTLYRSLVTAKLQDPAPSKMYGVRVAGDAYAAALSSLEAADDVTFVALAEEVDVGVAASGSDPPTGLTALKAHVEQMTAEGQRRLGVAAVDPARPKSPSYVQDVAAASASLKSDSSRMVLMAARGAQGDVATAAMTAMAGFEPQVSMVLKRIRGITIPIASQYSPSEIKGLSEEQINPVIDPALIPGTSLHFAEGRCFTSDESQLYIDAVRVVDHVHALLRFGLIGSVGDARITTSGLTSLRIRTEGILEPLQRNAVIDGFTVRIPVLDILNLPAGTRSATDDTIVATARANRAVDILLTIQYGPAVHLLLLILALKF